VTFFPLSVLSSFVFCYVFVFSVLFHLLTPEQPYFFCPLQQPQPEVVVTTYPGAGTVNSPVGGSTGMVGLRRCRALYDCEADNEDELSFREGEVIIVTNEQTDDENWMEGAVETDLSRRGMFPISFVHMLAD
jgi:Arf-GAP/SH3 domain/ANK repeat/PH domain-containing protein